MIMLGNALRNIGYNVYLPRIPSLKKINFRKNIDWFAHCYKELVNNKIQNKENIMIVGLIWWGCIFIKGYVR